MTSYVGETRRFICAFTAAQTFTADAATDTYTATSHGFANGNPVTVRVTEGQLPSGLYANTTYYIVNKADNTFQLATGAGGSAVSITTAGSGTLEVIGPKDPTTISLTIEVPAGTETTYTYAGGTVSKLSTGVYYKDVSLDSAGAWKWFWTSTGTPAVVDKGVEVVQAAND